MPIPTKSRAIRDRLHRRRSALLAHYNNMLELADDEQTHEIELVDVANEQWDLRLLSRMSDADVRALTNVVAALERLDTGAYGVCTDCGIAIESERLRILPEAAQCLDCAAHAEEREQVWHLGVRS